MQAKCLFHVKLNLNLLFFTNLHTVLQMFKPHVHIFRIFAGMPIKWQHISSFLVSSGHRDLGFPVEKKQNIS